MNISPITSCRALQFTLFNDFGFCWEILKRRQLNVTSFEETRITGTVSADEDALFFTSIPYDKGWTVKLDGKEIDESDYVALADSAYLSFKLPAGEHTVELSFMPRGLILGAGISAFTVLALIVAAIIFARRRKKAALVPVIQPAEAESEPMSVSIDLPDESSAEQAESLEIGTEESEEEETATQEIGEESNSENPEAAQIIEEPASQEEAAETTVETEEGSGEPEDKTE